MRKQRLAEKSLTKGANSSSRSSLAQNQHGKKHSVAPPNVQDYGAKIGTNSVNSYNQQPGNAGGMGKISLMGFGNFNGGHTENVSHAPSSIPQFENPVSDNARPISTGMLKHRKHSSEDDQQVDDENLEINDNPNEVTIFNILTILYRAAPTPTKKRSQASLISSTRFCASTLFQA